MKTTKDEILGQISIISDNARNQTINQNPNSWFENWVLRKEFFSKFGNSLISSCIERGNSQRN
jgi:hypothetical protein